jgi:hypothetical protein
MKRFFSLLALLATTTLAFAQMATLQLDIEALGAEDEDVLGISLTITTGAIETFTVVTMTGPEATFEIDVPADAMQGTIFALTESCQGDSIFAETFMVFEEQDTMGMNVLTAELELPYCNDDDGNGEEFDWEGIEIDALTQYLDSLCGGNADIDGMYCGMLENLTACLDNDSAACEDLAEWLDAVEWVWQDEDEDEDDDDDDEEECDASLLVVQAFDADSNAIANALFVYVLGYDEDNDFYWNFGDEGSSTDPLPTWDYETDGPYVLCLTVTGEDSTCADTFCFSLSVDSLGWFDGVQGGFTITALPGEPSMVASVDSPASILETPVVYPNPSFRGDLSIQWSSNQPGPVQVEVLDLTGKVVFRHQHACTFGAQNLQLTPEVGAGLHLVRLTQGGVQRTVKWLVH